MSNVINIADYMDNYKIVIDGEPETPLGKLIEKRSKAIASRENIETIKELDNKIAELGGWRLRENFWQDYKSGGAK